jgi:hypothetical protein
MDFLRGIFNMGDSQNAYDQVYGGGAYQGQPHKSSLSHELIGGAAGFAGKNYFLFD